MSAREFVISNIGPDSTRVSCPVRVGEEVLERAGAGRPEAREAVGLLVVWALAEIDRLVEERPPHDVVAPDAQETRSEQGK